MAVIVLTIVVPSEVSAHVAVHDTVEIVLDIDAEEPEPHCHGEIECVVTLYPATLVDSDKTSNQPADHVPSQEAVLAGAPLRHDPPVPILT